MTDERALKLARNVYAQYIRDKNGEDVDAAKVQELVNGDIDGLHGVQIALAAIKLTTQLGKDMADNFCFFTDIHEWAAMTKKDVSARACREIGSALGRNEHLPADGGENV